MKGKIKGFFLGIARAAHPALLRFVSETQAEFPHAPGLQESQLKNCRVVENRAKLLERLPKNAICAEVGAAQGKFAERILKATRPRELHLIDHDKKAIDSLAKRFAEQIAEKKVFLHGGESWGELEKFPDSFFDWVYIDTSWSQSQVKRDIGASAKKIKKGGMIVVNNYIFFGHNSMSKTGVIEAVNEFCNSKGYEMVFLALHPQMFCSVAIKKMKKP